MNTGKCRLCGAVLSKRAFTNHLKSCLLAQGLSGGPPQTRTPKSSGYFHVFIEGRYSREYWLHLAIAATAKLSALDSFLRHVWLECCGHMSAFGIGGESYSSSPMEEMDDRGMNVMLSRVLAPGISFTHEYDFGTTTELAGKIVAEIPRANARLSGKPIQVLARNDPPAIPCVSCGKNAAQICSECAYNGRGCLCEDCAKDHECGEEMLLPIVNSPRVGMCGYTGPATEPQR